MKLVQFGSNQNVLVKDNGDEVLFSYETPVAGFAVGLGYWKTDVKYSRTTSKHINSWLNGNHAHLRSTEEINSLVRG